MADVQDSSGATPEVGSCPFTGGSKASQGSGDVATTHPRSTAYFKKGITALSVLLAIVAVISFPLLQARNPKVLGRADIASLVSQAIQSQTGQSRVPQVACPSSEPVHQGRTFYCSWTTHNAHKVLVKVVETSDLGSFSVHIAPKHKPTAS